MAAYRYRISLRLWHPSMDPMDMSAALDIQPHNCWRAGEPRVTHKGVPLEGTNAESFWTGPAEKGSWPPTTLACGIEAALEQFSGRRQFLQQIRSEGGRGEFFIGWFFDGPGGDLLPAALMAKAADLGIDLSFDVYALKNLIDTTPV